MLLSSLAGPHARKTSSVGLSMCVAVFLVASCSAPESQVPSSANSTPVETSAVGQGSGTMSSEAGSTTIGGTGQGQQGSIVPQCNSVEDCLSQMTLDEKIGQMTQASHLALETESDVTDFALGSLLAGGGGAPTTGNTPTDWADMVDGYQEAALRSRLGIPILFGVDAVHGHSNVFGTTIFPHNIGLGATRNPELVERIGEVTAAEVYATGIRWNFAPCLCVARDERWGRTYESFGETPELASMMTAYIDGMQGDLLSARNSVLATAKHWVGDGGTTRGVDQGDTEVTEAELSEVHIAPFTEAIRRNVGSVMPSYSSWNGQKLHGDEYLLTEVLRDDLGFAGFVISDWAAIDQLPGDYASDVRTSINAGIDMVMVPDEYELFIETLRAEVNAGNVSVERIDEAVTRILQAKFDLGLFDQPFSDRSGLDDIGSASHREVARQAVQQSLVLLKNDDVLPIPAEVNEIVVAGLSADNIGVQSGGWTISWQGGSGATTVGTSILEGIQKAVDDGVNVTYDRRGNGALTGDVGIVVVGEQPYAEGRGDSLDISLRASELSTIDRVCSAMPCVVVLVSGRPLIVSDIIENVDAFVAAWLPGSEGAGIADVLFGEVDFTGTLPMTWPRSVDQLPINVGDSDYDPLYPYGFGLTMFDNFND